MSSIIDRVQKLLALSKSSNIHEATNAAAAANKLIDQHRLSEADLESKNDVQELEPIEEDTEVLYETGKVTTWKQSLIGVLTRHYGVVYWNDNYYPNGRKVSRFRIVGRRSDLAIVKYMFNWLQLEITRLSTIETKGLGRVFAASYCVGFVNGIAKQLKATRMEAQKDATETAIIKINAREEEARKRMYELHTDLVTVKNRSAAQIDGLAYRAGQSQGEALHLGATMNSGVGSKLLGQ